MLKYLFNAARHSKDLTSEVRSELSKKSDLKTYVFFWILFTAAIVVFSFVLQNSLVWDDLYLVDDTFADGHSKSLYQVITAPFWETGNYTDSRPPPYWRPLTSLLIHFAQRVFLSCSNCFHAISLLALLGSALSFFFLLTRIMSSSLSRPLAAWIALIFLVHPMSVEVVCLVSNVADHLVFILICLQVLFCINYLKKNKPWFLVIIFISGFAACLFKELGVITAASAFLAVQLSYRKQKWSLLYPLIIASILPVVIYWFLRSQVLDENTFTIATSFFNRCYVVFISWGQVLQKALFPVPVGTQFLIHKQDAVKILFAILAVGIFLVSWIRTIKNNRSKTVSVGFTFAFILVSPSFLSINPSGEYFYLPTRYFHLPLAGLFIAFTNIWLKIWNQKRLKWFFPIVVIFLLLLSTVRILEWRDNISLWSAEMHYNPNSSYAIVNLVIGMNDMGAYTEAEKIIHKAESVENMNEFYKAHLMYSEAQIALFKYGNYKAACKLSKNALSIMPWSLDFLTLHCSILMNMEKHEEALKVMLSAKKSKFFSDYQKREMEKRIEIIRLEIKKYKK